MSNSPTTSEDTDRNISNERLNTLIDGIFAIVLTLLVLDLQVPETAPDSAIAQQLLSLWPNFFSYVFSFIILSLFWLGHQIESRYIRATDHLHLWLSLIFMLFIALLPFSASLLGTHPASQAAIIFYSCNIFIASLLRYIHWRYITHHHRLVDRHLSHRLISSISKAFLSSSLICLGAIALSFISTNLSLLLLIVSLANALFRIGRIFHHHINPAQSQSHPSSSTPPQK